MNRSEIVSNLKSYKEKHQKDYSLVKIGIFGSYVQNTAVPESDIDIVVVIEKPDLFLLGTIKTELEELFGNKVDIVRFRENMNPFLKKRILKETIYA